jgi:hypothetical protein
VAARDSVITVIVAINARLLRMNGAGSPKA